MGREYPIIVQQYLADRRNKDGISKIHVRSETTGKLVSLASLVDFKEKGTSNLAKVQQAKSCYNFSSYR